MLKALVPAADGSEEMELVIIIDVLRRAGWDVTCASIDAPIITASRNVRIQADTTWDQITPSDYDIIILPGGNGGTEALKADTRVLTALREFHDAAKPVAAVCAAPLVLQAAGILTGRRATCHPGAQSRMTATSPVQDRVVIDGNVVTSQGPGTSFEFALALIREFDSPDMARAVAAGLVLPGGTG